MKLKDFRALAAHAKKCNATDWDIRAAKVLAEVNGLNAGLKYLTQVAPRRPHYAVIVVCADAFTDTAAITRTFARTREKLWPEFNVLTRAEVPAFEWVMPAIAGLGIIPGLFVPPAKCSPDKQDALVNEEMLTVAIDQYNAVLVLAFPVDQDAATTDLIQKAKLVRANGWPVMLAGADGSEV